jgi:RNA-splicing ligase RtcB
MEQLKIYAATLDERAEEQIKAMAASEAYGECIIRIMPDCHAGAGCTIGTVVSLKDRIVPDTVGVDIGCGMLVACLGRQEINMEQLDRVVNDEVPSGFAVHDQPIRPTVIIDNLYSREAIDLDLAQRSIGSLGGGNHFIEVDVDDKGCHYLVIHSGSRNLGKRVCEYWQQRAEDYCKRQQFDEKAVIARLKAEGRQREIADTIREGKAKAAKVSRELAYVEGKDAEQYLFDMRIAQEYAIMNRQTMANIICRAMGWKPVRQFTTIHNYIDLDHRILRKGAVSALHGEELIIPMNMRDGSLLCFGRGNIDWLYSAPHGAGRLMSRKQAIDRISLADFEQSMKGIYTTSVCRETIDESPMVYKPMQEIVSQVGPTVEVASIIKPIYNFKAKTPEKPDWKALRHKLPRKEDAGQ